MSITLDKLLNSSQLLSEVLSDLGKEKSSDKYFVLHNFNNNLDDPPQRSLSLSSSTSSSSSSSANRQTSSKVFPEIFPHRNPYSHSNHPVMTRLDSNTEAILKRVDAALESFEKNNVSRHQKKSSSSNFPSPMSVSRNECGVDIHLPHGLLRSTILSDKQTQYSLMTAPNTLVLQKILPADNKSKNNTNSISGEEMATLIKYGSQYLDTYDTANKPSLLSATNRLTVEKDSEKSLSSLEDLEKVHEDIYMGLFLLT